MIRPEAVSVLPAAKPPELRCRALGLVTYGEPVVRVAKDLGIIESCLLRDYRIHTQTELSGKPRQPSSSSGKPVKIEQSAIIRGSGPTGE